MDLDDSPTDAAYRVKVRQFLNRHAKPKSGDAAGIPEISLPQARAWQALKAEAGFAGISLPKRYGGREGSVMQELIYDQEEARYEVPAQGLLFTIGLGHCIPALLAYANEAVLEKHVPASIRGDETWCQLFSEPSGGSDLASLRTRAIREGETWRVNGQKVWTSGAHLADYGLLLVRTDPSVPKHVGLTAFFVDMQSPGIDIRPIRQIDGTAHFNEVFFTDLVIPDQNRLGAPGEGWKVAVHTLMNERLAVGKTAVGPKLPHVVEFARKLDPSRQAAFHSRIADAYIREKALQYTAARVMTALSKDQRPGPEASAIKYLKAAHVSDVTALLMDMQGVSGLLHESGLSAAGVIAQSWWLRAPGEHVGGGTDEILLNVIGERVLRLPAEPRGDRDVPFNELA